MKVKLPKQWKYWCRKYGLKPHVMRHRGSRYSRNIHAWFYLTGFGRVWRVNCYGHFQIGDLLTKFDRWALCNPMVSVEIPKTEKEFDAAIVQMNSAIVNRLPSLESICGVNLCSN